MNILFAVPYVPSLVRVRPYNLIRHLSARGHDVTVVTLWTDEGERRELEDLRKRCADVQALCLPAWRSFMNCLGALSGREPLQATYSWSTGLAARLAHLKSRADIVHIEHLRGVRYGLGLASAAAGSAPVVWDSVDCISDLFERAAGSRGNRVGRLIRRLELARTRRYEGWLVSQFDRVLVSSSVDRDSLLALSREYDGRGAGNGLDRRAADGGRTSVTVLPNGVDLDYFTPADQPRDPDSLVFSGKMSYHANESAVLHLIGEIMPRVWAKRPSARVTIVGKDPSRRLHRLAARHASRVALTGTVPDIRPYLGRASVAAVPLVYGAGCQNKVLEAMASATPVIATSRAVSALETQPQRDVVLADDSQSFADAVVGLLENPSRRREIGQAGRRYVEAHHRWDRISASLEGVYEEVIDRRRHRGVQPESVSVSAGRVEAAPSAGAVSRLGAYE